MKAFPRKRGMVVMTGIAFCIFVLSGCVTSEKIDGWIGEKYGTGAYKPKTNDYISVKMQDSTRGKKPLDNTVCITKKDRTKVLPILLYWRFEESRTSTLNPNGPFKYFNSAFLFYANSKGLRQKLNREKLELSIGQMPNVFSWKDVTNAIIPIVHRQAIFFQPKKQDVVVRYRVLKNGEEIKTGSIIIPDINRRLYLKYFQFPGKKFIGRYLDQYNNNLEIMSHQLADELLAELQ